MPAPTPDVLYIGLDAGGSKTALLAQCRYPPRTFSLEGPASNAQRLGADGAARVLADLITTARQKAAGASFAALCAGIAGAGRPEDQAALTAALRRHLGARAPQHLLLMSDAEIALEGAFEGESGVIIIVGTGSILLARTEEGKTVRAGGWGYILGDEGGGYALGRSGLQAVAAALDGGPATRVQALLADQYGLTTAGELIRNVYREDWPIQQVAPLALRAAAEGDAVARRIVAEQAGALMQRMQWLVGRHPAITPRVALLGGLVKDAFYKQTLLDMLHSHLPTWTCQEPRHAPVVGALRRALATGLR